MCRAYLSDFKDIFGKTYFTGRANIGAASLNLPMIYMKAKEDGVDFYETLTHYLEMIRTFLQKRYNQVGKSKASTNPLAFTQGGMKGGFLKPDEEIAPLLKGYTASFGISALNELNVLMSGVNIHEEDEPSIEPVVDFIIEYIETAKEEDGNLYAAYGVPAESLAGTQLKQFRDKYGVIGNVSDREYFSNSFHCHVSAEISPFEKQDKEFENFHKINGGHIQYSRVDTSRPELVKGVVLRAMDMGFYAGVNANHTFCDDCGWTDKESRDVCGNCGSDQLMEINRVCGYLGFSKQKGNTRFNDSKLAELEERVSM